LEVFSSFIALRKSVSPVSSTKNLKIAEHVHIHVLQLPTKFQEKKLWQFKVKKFDRNLTKS